MEILHWSTRVCVPAVCQVADCHFVIPALSRNDALHTYSVTDVGNSKGCGEGADRTCTLWMLFWRRGLTAHTCEILFTVIFQALMESLLPAVLRRFFRRGTKKNKDLCNVFQHRRALLFRSTLTFCTRGKTCCSWACRRTCSSLLRGRSQARPELGCISYHRGWQVQSFRAGASPRLPEPTGAEHPSAPSTLCPPPLPSPPRPATPPPPRLRHHSRCLSEEHLRESSPEDHQQSTRQSVKDGREFYQGKCQMACN